ncbi:YetF domain-containing protein [Pseudonocardia benzenivorans]|uniref:YetF domain-containing protein n=1 Tax=Pseudonocardia benzenivorans TaxID=228005 RepID=A0ABW3VCM3_9PSEU
MVADDAPPAADAVRRRWLGSGRTRLRRGPLRRVVALTTLFAVQRLLGRCRRSRAVRRLLDRDPVLLMDAGGMRHEAMRRVRVTEDEVRQRLRLAGIGDPREVGWVVLERSGQISVVRASSGLDPALLTDVRAQAHDRAA